MFDEKTLKQVHDGMGAWWDKAKRAVGSAQETKRFSTVSDLEIKPIYTPDDVKDLDYDEKIGYPGRYPYTRGCQRTCTGAGCGPFGCSPALAVPRTPTAATTTC